MGHGQDAKTEAAVIGKYLLGVLSGGALVIGGLVVGSALFPSGPRSADVVPAADQGIAPVSAVEPESETEAVPAPDPAPVAAQQVDDAPDVEAEPKPDAASETESEGQEDSSTAPTPETSSGSPLSDPTPGADASPAPLAAATEAETAAPATVPANPVTQETAVAAAAEPAPEATSAGAEPTPAADPAPQAEAAPPPPAEPPAPAADAEVAAVSEAPAPVEVAEPVVPRAPLPLPQLTTDGVLAALDRAAAAPPPAPGAADPALEPAPADVPAAAPTEEPATAEAEAPPAAEVPPAPSEAAIEAETADLPGEAAPALPGQRPEALPGADEVLPEPDLAELPAAETEEAPSTTTFRPAPGLGDKASGVVVRRPAGAAGQPMPGTTAEPADAAEAETGDPRPIVRHAASFDNPDGKPAMAIVLIDNGGADLDRGALAALPFPVSVALDPLDPATPDRAAAYRAAGKEVVMLATGIAEGAQASDIEVAFQSMDQGLPEAVAVMDLAQPVFQQRRPLASLVVPVVGSQGRGLLTWDQGLNAADQVARREDIPAAVIFRDLASAGTDRAAIRRTLDRALFKAGQDGRVAVAGEATPETLAALVEWSVEGRGATVALAPLTAVLTVD